MNPENCEITKIHIPIKMVNGCFQCRYCHLLVSEDGVLIQKLAKVFDRDEVYTKTLKYYISKGYDKDHANSIAEKIVKEQIQRHGIKSESGNKALF